MNMKIQKFLIIITLLYLIFSGAQSASAATPSNRVVVGPLEVSGWIPYWRKATGTAEALAHLDLFTEINPFGYTVKKDGSLYDAMEVDKEPLPSLVSAARAKKVRVIPTVMWSDANAMENVLSSAPLRAAHIKAIVTMVNSNNFDGVDIDYEGKKASTREHFSLFLKELYAAMGKKWVMCTIEPRTPLSSRYDTIPTDLIEYANDYSAINKYCDRVRIMAYDQGAIDLRLNEKAIGPYVPVADPQWVEKVVTLAAETISKKKIVLGIPTYGYEYKVTSLAEGYRYERQWAFNPRYALDLAQTFKLSPVRNSAGELSFMYSPTSTPSSTHILWWSDGLAMRDKILLARKLGLRGVAFFKIDGGADPILWNILQ